MYSISWFFVAAAGGFVLMAAITIQAAVALFSSIPLTRRHKAKNPEFDAKKAYRRIVQVTVLTLVLTAVVSALVIYFASPAVLAGYAMGFLLALVLDIKRMSPNNSQNQEGYEQAYADCYPPSSSRTGDQDGLPPESDEAES